MKSKVLPLSIFGILICSQAAAMIFRIDVWPLSCYPMFSETKAADRTGAFALQVVGKDGSEKIIHLHSSKNTWYTYTSLLEQKEYKKIEIRMRSDLDYYMSNHRELSGAQFVELRLLDRYLEGNEEGLPRLTGQVLHRIQL